MCGDWRAKLAGDDPSLVLPLENLCHGRRMFKTKNGVPHGSCEGLIRVAMQNNVH